MLKNGYAQDDKVVKRPNCTTTHKFVSLILSLWDISDL